MLKAHQTLENLRFSKRQDFFWVEDAKIFTQIDADQPANLLSGIPADRVAEYRGIIQSRDAATSKLLNQIEGQKVSKTGKIIVGKTRLDESTFAMRLYHKQQTLKPAFPMLPNPQATHAEHSQQLKNPTLKPGFHDLIRQVIAQKTKEGDDAFLKKFFRKPSGGKKLQNGFSPVQEFLVDFWCGQCNGLKLDRSDLPPLCFFTDEALESYCAYALGKKSEEGDVGRQRRRMGLIQAQSPKIKIVIQDGDVILLKA